MRVDLAAQLLQAAAFHAVLQFQRLRFFPVQLPLDLIFLLQCRHLLCHGMLHDIEGFRQLGDLRLFWHGDIRCVKLAAADSEGGRDHLLHRCQKAHDHHGRDAAKPHAECHHHRLQQLDALAQVGNSGIGGLGVQNGRLEQLQGVLPEIFAAGSSLCIVQPGSLGVIAAAQVIFQFFQQGGVGLIGGIHRTVQHPLLVADVIQTVQAGADAPEPRVADRDRCLQPGDDFFALAVLPAVVFQRGDRAFHTALKPADGVEAAHLLVLHSLHSPGLIPVEGDLHRKRRKECRKAQTDTLLEGDLQFSFFHFPAPFAS